ncbi:EAL domain-containing protein [Ruminococcus sp. AF41-9]|nr:EAL domain-containing protein [Ruminococcus sp. AF41-9]
MSFVRQIENNPKTRSIIRFMIDMAHEMGIRLVAEGAETPAQVEFLRENGCDYFLELLYFYKPMPENEFVTALEKK